MPRYADRFLHTAARIYFLKAAAFSHSLLIGPAKVIIQSAKFYRRAICLPMHPNGIQFYQVVTNYSVSQMIPYSDSNDPIENARLKMLMAETKEEAQEWGETIYQFVIAGRNGKKCPGCPELQAKAQLSRGALPPVLRLDSPSP